MQKKTTGTGTASSRAVVAPEVKQAAGAKRRRKMGVPLQVDVAQEGQAAETEEDAGLIPVCLGCGRLRDLSADFRNPDEKVAWAYPDGRGQWCQDCHTVFRTCYQHQHTLRLLERWLKELCNLIDFQQHLFAYLSIQIVDNKQRILRTDVEERLQLLLWAAAVLGVPLQPSMLTFVTPGEPLDAALDTRSLVPVETGTGIRVAVWKPLLPALAAFGAQPFPRPFFNRWQAFPPTTDQDRAFLLPFAGATPKASTFLPAVGVLTDVASAAGSAVNKGSKLEIRCGLLLAKAKELMAAFQSEEWGSLKEPNFKKLLNEAAVLQTEATNRGHEDVYRSASLLANGLCTAKEFVKQLRDHCKTKQPFGKCEELAEPAAATLKWLGEQLQIQPSASFRLLVLKAGFVQQFLVANSLEEATTHLINNGLADVFRKQSQDVGRNKVVLSPSLWLRSVFYDALQNVLSQECPESSEATEVIAEVHADLVAAEAVLKGTMPTGVVDEFLLELLSFVIVLAFGAGQPDPEQTPKQVAEAIRRVTTADYLNFSRGLFTARVWQRSLSAAAASLQASSQDSLGDGKLARALAILQDKRLPHVQKSLAGNPDDRTAVVDNAALLTDGSVVDALGESVAALIEALGLWSPVRCEAQVVSIGRWAGDMVDAISGVHELLWLAMEGVIAQCEMSEAAGHWTKEQADVLNHSLELLPDDEALTELCRKTWQLMSTLPACIRQQVEMPVWEGKLQTEIPHSIRARGLVMNLLDLLSGGGFGEEGSDALVEQWRLLRSGGSQKQSPLAHLMDVLAAVEQVRKACPTSAAVPASDVIVTLLFREGEAADAEELTASLQSALSLPTDLPHWRLFVRLRQIATESFQHILGKFGEALCYQHAHFDSPADAAAEADGWADAVSRLVKVEAVSVKNVAKVFSTSRDKWPCEACRTRCRREAGPVAGPPSKECSYILVRSVIRDFRVQVFFVSFLLGETVRLPMSIGSPAWEK